MFLKCIPPKAGIQVCSGIHLDPGLRRGGGAEESLDSI
jgi:hypothetical protein